MLYTCVIHITLSFSRICFLVICWGKITEWLWRLHIWLMQTLTSLFWPGLYPLNIGIMVRVFTNSSGDLGSVPGQVIPKTQKMILKATLIKTQHYKVRIKGKAWSNPRKGVVPSSTPWCSSYQKGSLWVTLDYGRQLYYIPLLQHLQTFGNMRFLS